MDGLKTGKVGGALGGAGSLLPFFRLCFIYFLALRRDTLFISFFLSPKPS
jgi:hypothetical protein